MLNFLTRKKDSKGLVAIEISPEGIAIAHAETKDSKQLKICEFHTTQNYSQVHEVLATAVAKNTLAQNNCAIILHPDHYKLFFINTPQVPDAEIRNAVRWQIKDMINYSLDDLAVDVFSPEDNSGLSKKTYVITAQKSLLQKMTKIVTDCQLTPITIDVREFGIRNIIAANPTSPEISGFLDFSLDNCLMVTVQKGFVRFVRRIPVGIRTIKEANSVTALTSEIQRSLHYCEVELKQKLPDMFFLPPNRDIDTGIIENLAKDLGKNVEQIDITKIITPTQQLNYEIQIRCWPIIGELMRKNPE